VGPAEKAAMAADEGSVNMSTKSPTIFPTKLPMN
jgi:hypothetical protein